MLQLKYLLYYSKHFERSAVKFNGGVRGGNWNKLLNFGGNLDHGSALVEIYALQIAWNMLTICGYLVAKGASPDG